MADVDSHTCASKQAMDEAIAEFGGNRQVSVYYVNAGEGVKYPPVIQTSIPETMLKALQQANLTVDVDGTPDRGRLSWVKVENGEDTAKCGVPRASSNSGPGGDTPGGGPIPVG